MILEWLQEPFQYAFMKKAFIGVIFASINCAVIGSYVVLRRMAFFGEALTHTLLPGIVFAYLRGIHLFWGALGASIITALGIGLFSSRKEVRQDTAIGVMLSFMFAIGVLMMGIVHSFRDFSSILFGSILGVTSGDIALTASITVIVLTVLFLLHKELELCSFDNNYGKLIRVKPNLLRYILLILTALSVVSAVQMIGALLTTSLLITPAAAAALVARTLGRLMLVSTLFAIVASIVGLFTSFYFQISSGAAIVVNCSIIFIFTWIFHLIYEWWQSRKN